MYEIFAKLLKEKGVTPYQVSKATGVAQSSLSDWKNGRSKPKYEKMLAIADYFGVSVDYLLGNDQKQKAPAETGERTVSDEDIMFALFNGADDITDEMFEEVKRFAQFIQERERNKPD